MLGDRCIKTWSSTESAVALKLGIDAEALTDSSSAKSFASRRGTGRIQHIEFRWLWLQEEVAMGRVRLRKVAGEHNPADILTKYLGLTDIKAKMEKLGIRLRRREETWEPARCFKSGVPWADIEDDPAEEEAEEDGEDVIAGIACDDCCACGKFWSACGLQTTAEGGC